MSQQTVTGFLVLTCGLKLNYISKIFGSPSPSLRPHRPHRPHPPVQRPFVFVLLLAWSVGLLADAILTRFLDRKR